MNEIHQKPAVAQLRLRQCLTIREKILPDDRVLVYTKSMLGGALAGQKNPGAPGRPTLNGYSAMKDAAHGGCKQPPYPTTTVLTALSGPMPRELRGMTL